MKKGDNGWPVLGRSATSLGVRLPQDISPDENGQVTPGTGGMSVSPMLFHFPKVLLPRRFQHLVPSARGSNKNYVWRMGVSPGLILAVDRPDHGTVQPDSLMLLASYEKALAQTRKEWAIDESGVK
jgi:hypothetical protein